MAILRIGNTFCLQAKHSVSSAFCLFLDLVAPRRLCIGSCGSLTKMHWARRLYIISSCGSLAGMRWGRWGVVSGVHEYRGPVCGSGASYCQLSYDRSYQYGKLNSYYYLIVCELSRYLFWKNQLVLNWSFSFGWIFQLGTVAFVKSVGLD